MATSANPAWAYKSRRNDPVVIKLAVSEMAESISKVQYVDSVICPFASYVLSVRDGSATETSENRLTVDFKNRQIQLPQLTLSIQFLPSSVDENLIRYCAFIVPPDYDTGSNLMHVVAISTWQQQNKDIYNIYMVVNQSDALLMMNAVSKLISRQSVTKAHDFHPLVTGRVFVSTCTSTTHTEKSTDCCDPQKLMFFILDPESLSFFEHGFSNKPTYDFRFYKERGPKAIDIIFVSKDLTHINLRQGNQICIIRKNFNSKTDIEAYDLLLSLLKESVIKPKPEEYFMDPEKHKMPVVASQQLESRWQKPRRQGMEQYENEQYGNEQYGQEQWINDLHTGHHINKNLDESMQLTWCTFEHDLRKCIEDDAVPFSAFESGGLDPNSTSHLQRSVEDIKDQLLNNDMVLALSRLQACLNVFKDTLLQPVSTLDQVTLMKRIYFLSGRDD